MNKRDIERGAVKGPSKARQAHGTGGADNGRTSGADASNPLLGEILDTMRENNALLRENGRLIQELNAIVAQMRDRQMIAAAISGIDPSRYPDALCGRLRCAIDAGLVATAKTDAAIAKMKAEATA